MALEYIPVKTGEQIEGLAGIADEIWHEYFTSILSDSQIDYMVERFQSVPAITEQLNNQGYEYYVLNHQGADIGYMGVKPEENRLFLSKLYLRKDYRGRGFASEAFAFLDNYCTEKGLEAVWLTVNRFNQTALRAYRKKGFIELREQVTDIGNGYVMDDYVMEKSIV